MKNLTSLTVLAVLLSLIAFHAINNYFILMADDIPMFADQFDNYLHSINTFKYLQDGHCLRIFYPPKGDWALSYTYPPLIYITAVPFYLFLGTSQDIACMSNIIYLALLIFSVYGIGKELSGINAGILAAFITSFMPGVFTFSRVFMMDFALTSFVVLTVYLLIKSNGFLNRFYILPLSFVVAVGLFTKQSYPIYVAAPFLVTFLTVSDTKDSLFCCLGRKVYFLSIVLILGTTIVLPWYLVRGASSVGHIVDVNFATGNEWKNFLNYLEFLVKHQLKMFLLVISAAAILLLPAIKSKNKTIILSSIIFPYSFLPFVFNAQVSRYTLPVLPFFALAISMVIFNIFDSQKLSKTSPVRCNEMLFYKQVLLLSIIITCFLQFFIISYIPRTEPFGTIDFHNRMQWTGFTSPAKMPYNIKEILCVFDNYVREHGYATVKFVSYSPLVLILIHHYQLNPQNVFFVGTPSNVSGKDFSALYKGNFQSFLKEADFVLTTDNAFYDFNGNFAVKKLIFSKINTFFKENLHSVKQVFYDSPSDQKIYIYRGLKCS